MSISFALPADRPWAARVRGAGVTVGAFALIAGTGFANGGYFPGPWGWTTLGAAWAAAAALVARDNVRLSRAAMPASASLTLLTVWTALSVLWSTSVTDTVLEAERTAVYAAALLAAVACAGRWPQRLLGGAWAAIVCLCSWGLLTRLVPDRWGVDDTISGYRLAEPIGYWNSFGLVAAMGTLLALGIAAHGSWRVGRAAATASIPLLVTTLYFTYSRGAWLALGFGLLAAIAVDRRRLQLLATAAVATPFAAGSVWRASVTPALTTFGAPLDQTVHEGHQFLLLLVVAALAAGIAGLFATRFYVSVSVPRTWQIVAVLSGLAVLLAVLVLAHPVRLARHTWHSFATAAASSSTANLNGRLFNLSGTGRVDLWKAAVHDATAHPLLGSGAGTYEVYWNRNRPNPSRVRDAHNLYLEMLAELGPLGLALLLGAFLLPVAAAVRRGGSPFASAALGGLVAYLAHSVVDWDWEITSVTLVALLCAGFLLAGEGSPSRAAAVRWSALAAAALLAGTGLYTIATRLPMNALDSAVARANWNSASRNASRAADLAPWSSEPWLHLGEGELNGGLTLSARLAFQTAVKRDVRNWVAWYDLARASSGTDRRAALARAKALNPRSPEIAAVSP